MNARLLFGGIGVVQLIVGSVLVWANPGRVTSVFGVAFLGGLFVTGAIKLIAGFVATDAVAIQQTTSGAFLLDGLLYGIGYQFFIDVGTYEAHPVGYVLAAGSALTMVGLSIGIRRGQMAFPTDYPNQP